jgi:hypothetical protein
MLDLGLGMPQRGWCTRNATATSTLQQVSAFFQNETHSNKQSKFYQLGTGTTALMLRSRILQAECYQNPSIRRSVNHPFLAASTGDGWA